jgi:CheY-like chemotaxis protein
VPEHKNEMKLNVGTEGREKTAACFYDLVFNDIHMPVMNGF